MPKQFRGSYTVTITPFSEGGKKIDLPAWRRFLDWQIRTGVPGIIILGTTGEFLTISDEERRMFVEATVKHVRGRVHVLVGTMNSYTPNAVRYSREAEELGADGLMIIPPYYYTPTEDEIFAQKSLAQLNAEMPLGEVHFDLDESTIREDARPILQRNADWMKRWPSTQVTVISRATGRPMAAHRAPTPGPSRARTAPVTAKANTSGKARLWMSGW